jgi:hypothetical protein
MSTGLLFVRLVFGAVRPYPPSQPRGFCDPCAAISPLGLAALGPIAHLAARQSAVPSSVHAWATPDTRHAPIDAEFARKL